MYVEEMLGWDLQGFLGWRKSLLGQAVVGWSEALVPHDIPAEEILWLKYLLPAACWLLLLNFLQTFPPHHNYATYYGLCPDAHQ